jgi:hypothetical protein
MTTELTTRRKRRNDSYEAATRARDPYRSAGHVVRIAKAAGAAAIAAPPDPPRAEPAPLRLVNSEGADK